MTTQGPITAAAITAGTEEECAHHNCPKRVGHPGDHDTTVLGTWEIPASWTLVCQMQFSGQLRHGAYAARETGATFMFGGTRVHRFFDELDQKYDYEPGRTEAAVAAYADWLNASVAAAQASRVAEMHRNAPHYMGRPCGATEGKVTSSAGDIKCNPCVTLILAMGECIESRQSVRGDCDMGLAEVKVLADVVRPRDGQPAMMCQSHAQQAAEHNEVQIRKMLVNA